MSKAKLEDSVNPEIFEINRVGVATKLSKKVSEISISIEQFTQIGIIEDTS
jgi:hypothetical protein